MLKAIIFDFDGVLHDTFPIAYGISKELYDLSEEEYKKWFDGNIYEKPQITPKKIEQFYNMQKSRFRNLVIAPNIKQALIKLNKSYRLFIISSNTEDAINTFLDQNNVAFFDAVLGLETHKSKIEKFEKIFVQYSKEECVFITDTLGDILESNRAGIRTIAVDFGFHERKRLAKGKPLKIVSSFDELVEAVINL